MHLLAEYPLAVQQQAGRYLQVAAQIIHVDIRTMDLRQLLDHLLQLAPGARIVELPFIPINDLPRQLVLHLVHHHLHRPAQPILIIPVVSVDKEDDRRHPDNDKGEQADKDDRRMYLTSDIQLPVAPQLAPMQTGPDQQGRQPEKEDQEQKGAEQIGKESDILQR